MATGDVHSHTNSASDFNKPSPLVGKGGTQIPCSSSTDDGDWNFHKELRYVGAAFLYKMTKTSKSCQALIEQVTGVKEHSKMSGLNTEGMR